MPSSGVKTCALDRKSTRLNSSHTIISYAVFCLKKTHSRRPRPATCVPAPAPPCPTSTAAAEAGRRRRVWRAPSMRRQGHGEWLHFFFLKVRRPPHSPPFPPPPPLHA